MNAYLEATRQLAVRIATRMKEIDECTNDFADADRHESGDERYGLLWDAILDEFNAAGVRLEP